MLNHQRRLPLPRPTAAPTATRLRVVLTLHLLLLQGLTVAASGAADLQVAGQADVAVGGDALVIVSESADILVGSELRITSEELGLYALPPAPNY